MEGWGCGCGRVSGEEVGCAGEVRRPATSAAPAPAPPPEAPPPPQAPQAPPPPHLARKHGHGVRRLALGDLVGVLLHLHQLLVQEAGPVVHHLHRKLGLRGAGAAGRAGGGRRGWTACEFRSAGGGQGWAGRSSQPAAAAGRACSSPASWHVPRKAPAARAWHPRLAPRVPEPHPARTHLALRVGALGGLVDLAAVVPRHLLRAALRALEQRQALVRDHAAGARHHAAHADQLRGRRAVQGRQGGGRSFGWGLAGAGGGATGGRVQRTRSRPRTRRQRKRARCHGCTRPASHIHPPTPQRRPSSPC